MKKIIIFLSILILVSCSADYLDTVNPNSPTSESYWQTEDDAAAGVNACYHANYSDGTWMLWIYFFMDAASDEGYSASPASELKEWTRFIYQDYDFSENTLIWKAHYKGIYRANQVLAYVPDIEFEDESDKEVLLAQAKFLRGFWYFYLAALYENVPLVLEPSNPDDEPIQYTYEEVMNQVIQDLTEAAVYLPEAWDDDNLGRATKGAALAYLGKAYMQLHQWQNAADAFQWMVEGDGAQYYDLVDQYTDNFRHTSENNVESVFEIQFSEDNATFAGLYGISNDIANTNLSFTRPQYWAPENIGWCDSQPRKWLIDEYKKEKDASGGYDTRLKANIFYKDMSVDYEDNDLVYFKSWSDWSLNDDEIYHRKYQSDYYLEDEDYYSPINFRCLRFADVLLSYAECLTQLSSTPPAKAIECVNRVRQRVSTNLLPLESSIYSEVINSNDDFLKRLQMERSLELCQESVRWLDLKRWNLWGTQEGLDELIERDEDFGNFVIGKSERYPIPQSDVDNNPNLNQNDNY